MIKVIRIVENSPFYLSMGRSVLPNIFISVNHSYIDLVDVGWTYRNNEYPFAQMCDSTNEMYFGVI